MVTTVFSDEAYKLAAVAAAMYPQKSDDEPTLEIWAESARDLVAACQAELNGKEKDDAGEAF